jgi:hypothetical protein
MKAALRNGPRAQFADARCASMRRHGRHRPAQRSRSIALDQGATAVAHGCRPGTPNAFAADVFRQVRWDLELRTTLRSVVNLSSATRRLNNAGKALLVGTAFTADNLWKRGCLGIPRNFRRRIDAQPWNEGTPSPSLSPRLVARV